MEGNEKQYMPKLSELASKLPPRSYTATGKERILPQEAPTARLGPGPIAVLTMVETLDKLLTDNQQEIDALIERLTPILAAQPTSKRELTDVTSASAFGQALVRCLTRLTEQTDQLRTIRTSLDL